VALGDEVLADYIVANWRHANLDERRYAICEFAEKLPNEEYHHLDRASS